MKQIFKKIRNKLKSTYYSIFYAAQICKVKLRRHLYGKKGIVLAIHDTYDYREFHIKYMDGMHIIKLKASPWKKQRRHL